MTYDNWLQSAAEEQYSDDVPDGYVHEDNVVDHDFCAERVQEIVDAVYMNGNVDTIEKCLDSLVGEFQRCGCGVTLLASEVRPVIKSGLFEGFTELTLCYAAWVMKKEN